MDNTIKLDLADKLTTCSDEVKARVLDVLYQSELKKRTDACVTVLAMIDEQQKAYKKAAKPDHETYTENGERETSGFTKERADELRRIRERISKLETALKKALEDNDFTLVLSEASK